MANFDLSVLFTMVDKFSMPLKKSMITFNRWSKEVKKADTISKQFGRNLQSMGKSIKSVGSSMALKLTLPLAILGGTAVKAAMDFESAFTGVRKTVKASESDLLSLESSLKKMARTIPLSTEEIMGIAEAGGQLGIAVKDMEAFTKVMADMGATTNLSARDAATQMARFATVTGMSKKHFERLGSTIVGLGNNMETTEAEISELMLRLSGTGTLVGLTEAEIVGLAATVSSLGIRAEAGGTAFSQVMQKLAKEVGSGSKIEKMFSQIAGGKSVEEFRKNWKEKALPTLIDFIEGLKTLKGKDLNIIQLLDELGMEGRRIADSLLRTAEAGDKLRTSVAMGNVFWAENIALSEEAALRYATAASKLKIFRNIMKQTSASFGTVFLPVIIKTINAFKPLLDYITDLSPETKMFVGTIGILVATMGPLVILAGALTASIGAIIAFPTVAIVVGALATAFISLGLAIATVIKNWEMLKREFSTDTWGSIRDMLRTLSPRGMMLEAVGKEKPLLDYFKSSPEKQKSELTIKLISEGAFESRIENVESDMDVSVINQTKLGVAEGY